MTFAELGSLGELVGALAAVVDATLEEAEAGRGLAAGPVPWHIPASD